MTLGERIHKLRKEKKMTLDELGAAIGTNRQAVYKYEKGIVTNIPLDRLSAIARALGTTPAYLTGWSENLDVLNVTFQSMEDFDRMAYAMDAIGEHEEAENIRNSRKENEQLLAFIQMFQGLDEQAKLDIISKMIMAGKK